MSMARVWLGSIAAAIVVAAFAGFTLPVAWGSPDRDFAMAVSFGCWAGAIASWAFTRPGLGQVGPYQALPSDLRSEFRASVLSREAVPADEMSAMTEVGEAYLRERAAEAPGQIFVGLAGSFLFIGTVVDAGFVWWNVLIGGSLAVFFAAMIAVQRRRVAQVRHFLSESG